MQVLMGQLLLDCVKAYNCLLPLVLVLPRQGFSSLPSGDPFASSDPGSFPSHAMQQLYRRPVAQVAGSTVDAAVLRPSPFT